MEPTGAPNPLERQNITESKHRGEFCNGLAEISCGVEDACAIQMHGEIALMGADADFLHCRDGRNGAARHVVGVLQGDEAGRGDVIRGRRNLRGEQLPGEDSAAERLTGRTMQPLNQLSIAIS